jgi:hypothetical protein
MREGCWLLEGMLQGHGTVGDSAFSSTTPGRLCVLHSSLPGAAMCAAACVGGGHSGAAGSGGAAHTVCSRTNARTCMHAIHTPTASWLPALVRGLGCSWQALQVKDARGWEAMAIARSPAHTLSPLQPPLLRNPSAVHAVHGPQVGRDFLPRGPEICTRRPLVLQLVKTPATGQAGAPKPGSPQEWGEFLHAPGKVHGVSGIAGHDAEGAARLQGGQWRRRRRRRRERLRRASQRGGWCPANHAGVAPCRLCPFAHGACATQQQDAAALLLDIECVGGRAATVALRML